MIDALLEILEEKLEEQELQTITWLQGYQKKYDLPFPSDRYDDVALNHSPLLPDLKYNSSCGSLLGFCILGCECRISFCVKAEEGAEEFILRILQ